VFSITIVLVAREDPVMATRKRETTREMYENWLQVLRFALAGKYRLLTVTRLGEVSDEQANERRYFTEVVTQISVPNPKHPKTGQRLLNGEELKSFFEGRAIQDCFLSWLGKQIADLIPANSLGKRYKKKFENLRVGRQSKLPPTSYLRLEYTKFILELKLAKEFLDSHQRKNRHFTNQDKERLLQFGRKDSFGWVPFVENGDLSLEQINEKSVQSTAKQMLSVQYVTGEETVHSRLSRRGS
jgi:hypothetical protein